MHVVCSCNELSRLRKLVVQDLPLQHAQLGAGLQAPLGKRAVRGLEGRPGRFGPASRVGQRANQLNPELLAVRMLRDERLELRNDLRESRTRKVRLDAVLKCGDVQLLEPEDLFCCKRLEPELGQRFASPQRERFAEARGSLLRLERTRGRDQPLELLKVDRVR